MTVRAVEPGDAGAWLRMRCALWPEGAEAEHREEIERFFAGDFPRHPWVVLVSQDGSGRLTGFAELSLRPHAEGCSTSPVAYLEGWYVRPERRRQGVGRALIAAAESWARSQGCSEFASDAYPDNHVSASAHQSLGFTDVGLVRCFRKAL
ncbi:MAG TPA: aminoglycoside 6'-N-acetyltransferase [Acidobacteriota bacterium]|nr:aminoglycoside 6'-N-acetyltransferase [Acidobacteriota bacterium]